MSPASRLDLLKSTKEGAMTTKDETKQPLATISAPVLEERAAQSLDLTAVPKELALPLLSVELSRLASSMTDLKDVSCQIDVSPSGATSLRFRAYSRF
jgi:hypothetical protein